MHPNPAFRTTGHARNLAFARERGFGTLIVSSNDGPLISHVPFRLSESGSDADIHLVRSNPIARQKRTMPATLAVTGPDGYVSPDWYGVDDQVPTWNYVAVHLVGTLEPLEPSVMKPMLDRQSAAFEERLEDKTPWTTDKMTPDVLDRMMRQILPFKLTITDIKGTWKLGQNKPEDVRLRAAKHIPGGHGSDLAALAALMETPPED